MKNAPLLLLVVALVACTAGLCFVNEGSVKALAGGDGVGEKSILEDVAYWCWPAKWEQYQQERMERQYERAVLAASRGE